MIDHYDAFISYKHAPADTKVAETVQKCLEHFRIPRKIRKKTGKKRIERIFRDKDELPITSSLGETISYALDHSDYLIVICSTRTKESEWVQREIEYFLRNHSKRQILTVLVDGEPQDVIPPILQVEERFITTSDGHVQTITTPLEPLSCDFRMSRRKAKKVELPRLASALIGCSYDELMNRRRHYAMRRTIFVFAAFVLTATGVTVYLLRSRDNLRRNYRAALRNQSKYLANESGNLLKKEQRLTALQLALEALPKDDKDERPVTPEAIRALTDATRAYVTDHAGCVSAAWNYRTAGTIQGVQVSPKHTHLAVYDSSEIVTVWDTQTHERILLLTGVFENVSGIQFISDDELLIWGAEDIYMYDVSTGNALWRYDSHGDPVDFGGDTIQLGSDDTFYILSRDNMLLRCSLKNGKKVEEFQLPQKLNDEDYYILSFQISPNEKMIALDGSEGFNLTHTVMIFPLDNPEKANSAEIKADTVNDLFWYDDANLLIAANENGMGASLSTGDYKKLNTTHINIMCLDPVTMRQQWKYDFSYSDVSYYSRFLKLANKGWVAFCSGNMADIIDMKTGKGEYSFNLNDTIVDMGDANDDGWPNFVTRGGGLGFPASEAARDEINLYQYFCDGLKGAVVADGVYVYQNLGREIIYYGLHVADPEWTELDHQTVLPNLGNMNLQDDVLVFLRREPDEAGNAKDILALFDFNDQDKGKQIGLSEDYPDLFFELLGADEKNIYLVGTDPDYVSTVFYVNVSSGAITKGDQLEGQYINIFHFSEGCIYYEISVVSGPDQLAVYDVYERELKKYDLPDGMTGFMNLSAFADRNFVIFSGTECAYLNMETGVASKLNVDSFKDWHGLTSVDMNAKGEEYVVSDGKQVGVYKKDGTLKYMIADQSIVVKGVYYLQKDKGEEEILVLYEGNKLYRYDPKDGSLLGVADISGYVNSGGTISFRQDKKNNCLYIQCDYLLSIVDTKNWVEMAAVQQCFGYDMPRDRIITYSSLGDEEYRIGYFKHYTLEELIQKGKDILGGLELTEEQKSYYGIGDEP